MYQKVFQSFSLSWKPISSLTAFRETKNVFIGTREDLTKVDILSFKNKLARWSLFSHILRRDKDIPANKATIAYSFFNDIKLRRRPKTTLPIVFNRDLALIQHLKRLHSDKDVAENWYKTGNVGGH